MAAVGRATVAVSSEAVAVATAAAAEVRSVRRPAAAAAGLLPKKPAPAGPRSPGDRLKQGQRGKCWKF